MIAWQELESTIRGTKMVGRGKHMPTFTIYLADAPEGTWVMLRCDIASCSLATNASPPGSLTFQFGTNPAARPFHLSVGMSSTSSRHRGGVALRSRPTFPQRLSTA